MIDAERPSAPGGRFPGFDVLRQRAHWDDATTAVIDERVSGARPIRFFTDAEQAVAAPLLARLMGYGDDEDEVDLVAMIDARLAENQIDGWNYDTMPPDRDAWRASLAAVDDEAGERCGARFADCTVAQQCDLIEAVRTWREPRWRGFPPSELWGLWTRYAATAFYGHPAAWNEIGFSGPAYPRGYKSLGVGKLEPFEVRDVLPSDDPIRVGGPHAGA